MNTHLNKKVICVKDIPSNLIEEAIFILKSDVIDAKNKKVENIRKEIILKETEDFVNEYSNEFSKSEVEEENKNETYKNLKLKIFLVGVLFLSVCYLISIII